MSRERLLLDSIQCEEKKIMETFCNPLFLSDTRGGLGNPRNCSILQKLTIDRSIVMRGKAGHLCRKYVFGRAYVKTGHLCRKYICIWTSMCENRPLVSKICNWMGMCANWPCVSKICTRTAMHETGGHLCQKGRGGLRPDILH